jgi:membrane protein involved in colicin uptake
MKLTESKLKQLIVETLQEGYMEYHRAKEEAHNKAKEIRSLRNQGKASYEDVRAAFQEYDNIVKNRDSYFTPEELEAERADNERRNREADARDRAEEETQAAAEKRRNAAELAAMKSTRRGYKDRGISMGPDDPGDVDDIYPQRS